MGKTTQETEVSIPTRVGVGCLAHRVFHLNGIISPSN